MKQWYASVYKGFIISGIISFIIGFFSQTTVALNAYIAGYVVFILGIMMILLIIFNNLFKDQQLQNKLADNHSSQMKRYSGAFLTVFIASAPFILILSVIGFMLYLMIKYQNKITSGHVSPNYTLYSNVGCLLLMTQMYIIYKSISSNNSDATIKVSKVTSAVLFLISVLFAINSVIIYTILNYFTTDGFRS